MTEPKSRLQKYSAPALEKGLDILELLSQASGRGLTHGEISEGVGRSKNEIFRMMVVLEERGYIERAAGDTFLLTHKLGHLMGPRNDTARMLDIARPFLDSLSGETRLSNHLWVLRDSRMQVAAVSQASGAYSLSLTENTQGQVFGSSAGACFLSGLPDARARLEALRAMGEQVTEKEYMRFDAAVEACNEDGVCALPNREANGVLEVSSPLDVEGRAQAVAVVTIPIIDSSASGNTFPKVVEHLKETTRLISDRMAFLSLFSEAPA